MEIGPGRGALTSHLAGRVKHLIIVEIDGRVIENLRGRFCSPAVTILHQDFLDVDLASWRDLHGSKIRLIGNIPYHLTSPILFKAFEERAAITDLTIMAQREVTRRIVAKPGSKEYGILSVSTWLYGVPEILFSVSPNCFYPKPKVTSSVLTIRLHDRLPEGVDPRVFETVVRTVFGKRRKTLRNGLKYLPYDEAVVERIMEGLTGVLDKRPEQLTPEQFAGLAVHIGKLIA
jgi:16S rRNA (adenine1518-N6/adenine1519-N6)-dimethyltransferase